MSTKFVKFQPTDQQRRMVEFMAACGHSLYDIAALIIDPATNTFIKHDMLKDVFSRELRIGSVKHLVAVEENVFRMALLKDNSNVAMRAAMFVLRSKAGWKEGIDINVRDNSRVIEGAAETLHHKIARLTGPEGSNVVPIKSSA